jgi:hypothetical protein
MSRVLCVALLLSLSACSGTTEAPDAGPADPGPCNPVAQSGCDSGQKCTIRLDTGLPTCSAAGAGAAYAPCSSDSDCAAGTACLSATPQPGYDGTQSCRPFCDPATQAHLACPQGGRCDFIDTHAEGIGFCEREAPDAGAADGG